MATPSWKINGQYYETCSCDFVCPCILTQLTARPTHGACTFAMGYKIERGAFGGVALDGIGFIVLGRTPEAMAQGNWTVGLIVDARASAEQREAVVAIASGAAGGPMGAVSGLVSSLAGVETADISFRRDGVSWTITAAPYVDMAASGAMGLNPQASDPLQLTHTGHPASDTLALCHATKSHVKALGFAWDDVSGRNNGHYASFAWQGA